MSFAVGWMRAQPPNVPIRVRCQMFNGKEQRALVMVTRWKRRPRPPSMFQVWPARLRCWYLGAMPSAHHKADRLCERRIAEWKKKMINVWVNLWRYPICLFSRYHDDLSHFWWLLSDSSVRWWRELLCALLIKDLHEWCCCIRACIVAIFPFSCSLTPTCIIFTTTVFDAISMY